MWKKLKEVVENKPFRKFFTRAALFSYALVAEVVLLSLLINFREIDIGIKTVFSDFPVNFLVFFILFFLAMSHSDLFKIKNLKDLTSKQFVPFFIANLIFVFSFYGLNQYLIANPATGVNSILFTILWWALGALIVIALVFAFFKLDYVVYLAKKKHLLVAGTFALVLAWMVPRWFFKLPTVSQWSAKFVAKIVYFLLHLFLEGTTYSLNQYSTPVLTVPGFTAIIGPPCSGLSGVILFLILFTVFIAIEHKRLDQKKVLIVYPLGALGIYLANILRIFAIFVAGHYVSAEFAMGIFHKNVGWMLFTTYFLAVIYLAYPWMRKQK